MREFRKSEALRRMRNVEGRINHTQLLEERRVAKLERVAERARLHNELLEKHKAAKEQRLKASGGPSEEDMRRMKYKEERKAQRTERRKNARAIIREANLQLAALRSSPRQETL